jgi:hypothetical protein
LNSTTPAAAPSTSPPAVFGIQSIPPSGPAESHSGSAGFVFGTSAAPASASDSIFFSFGNTPSRQQPSGRRILRAKKQD